MSRSGPTPGSPADESESADPEAVGRAILLRQLTLGPRTRAQLAQAMTRRNVPPEVAEPLLERFTEVGLIDDAAFAELLIRSEAAAGGLSRRRVAQRLRQKGVPGEVVDAAVGGIDPQQEYEAARELAQRRLRRMAGLDAPIARRRMAGLLARRGYSPEIVHQVLRHVLGSGSESR